MSSSSLLLLITLTLTLVTITSTHAQCQNQATIRNDPSLISNDRPLKSVFINQTLSEGSAQSGRIKDTLIAGIGNGLTCDQITILAMNPEFGDGFTWGSIIDFTLPAAQSAAYDSSVAIPTPVVRPVNNAMSTAAKNTLGIAAASAAAIPAASLSKYYINNGVQRGPGNLIGGVGTGQASQGYVPCTVSDWDRCDPCAKDKTQVVRRYIVNKGTEPNGCPPLQLNKYCDDKCKLKDWQIGLIALACFLFLVLCCICCYCCYRRRTRGNRADEAAERKRRELEAVPTTKTVEDEKIDVDVVDPVRPSTADEGQQHEFHRASQETLSDNTGPRPTATFHDDEPDDTNTTEEKEAVVVPPPVPVAAPGRTANVVRVHL